MISDDDDVGLHVLGCRVDILGTNCKMISVNVISINIVSSKIMLWSSQNLEHRFCRH